MSKHTFTPGPWRAELFAGKYNVWPVGKQKPNGTAVAYDANEADARLIAAAPDLFAALEVADEALCDLPLMDSRIVQIRAAIAKATGATA